MTSSTRFLTALLTTLLFAGTAAARQDTLTLSRARCVAVREGTLVVVEHNRNHDFSRLPGFMQQRVYGSVNFSIFRVGGDAAE